MSHVKLEARLRPAWVNIYQLALLPVIIAYEARNVLHFQMLDEVTLTAAVELLGAINIICYYVFTSPRIRTYFGRPRGANIAQLLSRVNLLLDIPAAAAILFLVFRPLRSGESVTEMLIFGCASVTVVVAVCMRILIEAHLTAYIRRADMLMRDAVA